MAFSFHITSVKSLNYVLYVTAIILLFLSVTLWQRVNLHIHLYSHFTQNSVVNVNWNINKKKKIEI